MRILFMFLYKRIDNTNKVIAIEVPKEDFLFKCLKNI